MEPVEPKPTSPLLVALAWIIVTVPLGWGVFTSIEKSLPLFQANKIAKMNL